MSLPAVAYAAAGCFLLSYAMLSIFSLLLFSFGATPVLQQADSAPAVEVATTQKTLEYADFLDQMLRLRWFLETPDKEESTRLYSSFDREGLDGPSSKAWFSNKNQGQFLGTKDGEQTEYIMVDAIGPGVVGKMHFQDLSGLLKFYVDGAESPSWEIEASELLSSDGPFSWPLVHFTGGSSTCMVPFPFEKSMRITTTQANAHYEIAVRKMPDGVHVPSWTGQTLLENQALLRRLARAIVTDVNPTGIREVFMTGSCDRKFNFHHDLHGNGIVQWLKFDFIGLDGPNEAEMPMYLRHLRLQILENASTKGEERVLVDVPFGDFFGTSPGLSAYQGWALSQTSGANPSFTVRYPMPYVGGFAVRIYAMRKLPKTIRLKMEIGFEQMLTPPPMRFRAKFFQQREVATRPVQDITLGELEGPGRLVGTSLSVLNPVREEWGNGSVKMWVDGESFPSWKGTDLYHHFERITRQDGPFAFGYTSMNRFHLNDSIPFQDELRFDVGVDHKADTNLGFEGVLYWYAAMDASATPLELTGEQLIPEPLPEVEFVFAQGAIEAEEFRLKRMRGTGETEALETGPTGASAGVLVWNGAEKESYATFAFDVTGGGQWDVGAKVFVYPGGPEVMFYLNGKEAGQVMSLNAEEKGWKVLPIGIHTLSNREHLLTVKILSESKAAQGPTFTMDFLQLKMHEESSE